MQRMFFIFLSTISGALILAFIAWGVAVLFFPTMNIDTAFNMIVIFFIIGGIIGFLFQFKKIRKYKSIEKQ